MMRLFFPIVYTPTAFREAARVRAHAGSDPGDVLEWLATSCQGRYHYDVEHRITGALTTGFPTRVVMTGTYDITARFEDRRDAVLFKLTWGGSL